MGRWEPGQSSEAIRQGMPDPAEVRKGPLWRSGRHLHTDLLGTWGRSPISLNCKEIFFCGLIFETRSPVSKVGLQCYVQLEMTLNS